MYRFVCWKWRPEKGIHPRKQIQFTAKHVNVLESMLKRNINGPVQLICITDDATGISDSVRTIPLWSDLNNLGGCFRRLRIFSPEMFELIGEDFFSIDLDTVIIQDITSLIEHTVRNYDFKIWGDTNPTTPYNGSFFYMKAGAKRKVWETFDPVKSLMKIKETRYVGTDQAWIGCCLGERESKWDRTDGIFSYRVHFLHAGKKSLDGSERLIFFHGSHDPSKPETVKLAPWIKDHWV